MAAERELGVDVVDLRGEAEVVQAGHHVAIRPFDRDIGESRPTPERQRAPS